jgi:xylan 1,4-beta-xylosidase
MRKPLLLLAALTFVLGLVPDAAAQVQSPEGFSGNPILWADVPDPSVIRVDSVYYMTSTTMHMSPGVPIMKSANLVDWKTIGYVYNELANADGLFMRIGQNAYGRGSWASSIRFHEGLFYVVTFSYTTGESYVFTSEDVEHGPWRKVSLGGLYHDASLHFDDDGQVYLVYGAGDIRIVELTADARSVKPGGVNRVLIPNAGGIAGSAFHVPGEGSHLTKIDGRYYLFLIVWPRGGMRTQLVYRADHLEGAWEGRIVLQDDGIAQGGIVDTPDGSWYALLFGDRGAVGRIPYLIPVDWEDGWPVFGIDGEVPDRLPIPSNGTGVSGIVASDEFEGTDLGLAWQWNHQPNGALWSLTARPGYFRLTNGRPVRRFVEAQNTLTQRTFGPKSSATTCLAVGGMNDGDMAGLGILMEQYAFIGVAREEGRAAVVMTAILDEEETEMARVPLDGDAVCLKVDADFRDMTDRAVFSYSTDGHEWQSIGDPFHMHYTLGHFMGARFALFSYARAMPGGHVDFDFFRLSGL